MGSRFSRPTQSHAKTADTDRGLRTTGLYERYNIARNHLDFYTNVAVSAVYHVPRSALASAPLEDCIYAALTAVLAAHPIMGVTLDDQGSLEPNWIRLPGLSLDLKEVVVFEKGDPNGNIDAIVNLGHRRQFERIGELPLWRATIISNQTLQDNHVLSFAVVFYFHHALGDGLSGGAFHLSFRDAINELTSSDTPPTPTTIIQVPPLALLPNLELEVAFPVSIWFVLKTVFQVFVYNPPDPLEWTGPIIPLDTPRPPLCNLRSFSLAAPQASALVSKCRLEHTTITSLFTILVARKLASMYPTHSHFRATIPFSMRKFMTSITARSMGAFVSNVRPLFSSEEKLPGGMISCRSSPSDPQDDKELWSSARQLKSYITTNTSSTTNQNIGLLPYAGNLHDYFLAMLGHKREHAFEVTNLGVFDGGAGDADAARNAVFDKICLSTGLMSYCDPHHFMLATAKNGQLTVTENWATGVVDEESVEELSRWLRAEMSRLAGGQKDTIG